MLRNFFRSPLDPWRSSSASSPRNSMKQVTFCPSFITTTRNSEKRNDPRGKPGAFSQRNSIAIDHHKQSQNPAGLPCGSLGFSLHCLPVPIPFRKSGRGTPTPRQQPSKRPAAATFPISPLLPSPCTPLPSVPNLPPRTNFPGATPPENLDAQSTSTHPPAAAATCHASSPRHTPSPPNAHAPAW